MTTTFDALGVSADLVAALAERGILVPVPHPDPHHRRRPRRPRRVRQGQDRARARPWPSACPSSSGSAGPSPAAPRPSPWCPPASWPCRSTTSWPRWPSPAACACWPSTAAPTWSARSRRWPRASTSSSPRPGRMIDLIERKEVSVDDLEIVVLDEADRMADMGFLPAGRVDPAPGRQPPPDPALLGHARRRGRHPDQALPARSGACTRSSPTA